jgi:tetratricopeptide (TPR) repeat protein
MSSKANITFILLLCGSFCTLCSGQAEPNSKRWDLMMIDEAPIWKNLLVNYFYADHQKFWPEKKKALQQIVNQFPDSQWADDAELILACGKFEYEGKQGIDNLTTNADAYAKGYFGDANEAIKDLRNIINKYPNAKTIISPWWAVGYGCTFDGIWEMNQSSLRRYNRDGSIRGGIPFGTSQQEKEVLAYFNHLDKYPILTKDVAITFIAEIYGHQKKYKEGAEELEKVIANTDQLTKTLQADRITATDANGFLIRGIDRPEYRAYISLVGCYEILKNTEKATATTDSFASIVNQGPNYGMMKRIGEFYDKHGLKEKAKSQYQQALNRINEDIVADMERSKHLEYIKKPTTDEERSPQLTQAAAELKKLIK